MKPLQFFDVRPIRDNSRRQEAEGRREKLTRPGFELFLMSSVYMLVVL